MRSLAPARLRRLLAAIARATRTIAGVPDYDRYLAHVRRHHPGTVPLSREAFVRERLDARYARPGARCC